MNDALARVSLPHNWRPREYQQEYLSHMFAGGQFPTRKRAQLVWHRRAGKDSTVINSLAVAAHIRTGTYWHMLPTLNQGRKVVWNGVDKDGRRIIKQAFPEGLIESINENDMLIRFKNGSFYQVVGSDNYDSLVGTNPLGVAFSEWSIADPTAWNFVRPILKENGGFATFIYTPRGKNHAHEMWEMAKRNKRWFTSHKTVRDTFRDDGTPVISEQDVDDEREEGVLEEIIQQEYYCSFAGVNVGSIYGRHLQKYAETNQFDFEERMGQHWNPDLLVFTAWDIGRNDATAVWFYQIVGTDVLIIDYVEGRGMDAEEWLEKLGREFPYPLATPALPHDAKAKTFSAKYTPEEIFIQNKLRPYIVKNTTRAQGINAVRALIKNIYFNTGVKGVRDGLQRLENYQYEYDEKLKIFSNEPLHDHNSHGSDAMRMLALSVEVMRGAFKNRPGTGNAVRKVQTRLGPALMLEDLFAQRDAQRRQPKGRIT